MGSVRLSPFWSKTSSEGVAPTFLAGHLIQRKANWTWSFSPRGSWVIQTASLFPFLFLLLLLSADLLSSRPFALYLKGPFLRSTLREVVLVGFFSLVAG